MIEFTISEWWNSRNRLVTDIQMQLRVGIREAEEIYYELGKFVRDKFRPYIRYLLKEVFRGLDVEAMLPDADEKAIFFGGWIGRYKIYINTLGEEMLLVVKPRIGWKNIGKMIREIFGIEFLGSPLLKPLLSNTLGVWSGNVISYSVMLNDLTRLALCSGLPSTTEKIFVTGEGLIGKPVIPRTVKLWAQGLNDIVVERKVLVPAPYPIAVLLRFHQQLYILLDKEAQRLKGHKSLDIVVDFIQKLRIQHLYMLTRDEFLPFLDFTEKLVDEPEILERAKKACGHNQWLVKIIDLYRDFIEQIPLAYRLATVGEREFPLSAIPSSKIYELWILKLFIDAMRKRFGRYPYVSEINDAGFEVIFGTYSRLIYNLKAPKYSKIVKTLAGSAPRPDYILGDGSLRAVADAKYRSKLDVASVERMLAYILDFSEKQFGNGDEVKGVFIMPKISSNIRTSVERTDISPKIRVFVIEAHPANRNKAFGNIVKIIDKVFH